MTRSLSVLDRPAAIIGNLRYDQQGRRESAAFAYTSGWLKTTAD